MFSKNKNQPNLELLETIDKLYITGTAVVNMIERSEQKYINDKEWENTLNNFKQALSTVKPNQVPQFSQVLDHCCRCDSQLYDHPYLGPSDRCTTCGAVYIVGATHNHI